MEEKKLETPSVDLEKIWNWGMDETCANSCSEFLIAHMHVINAMTLITFLFVCYVIAFFVNYFQYKNFKTTVESLLFTSILVYSTWNIFFGFPFRKIEGNENKIKFSYSTHAMSHLTSVLFSVIILFTNEQMCK